MAWEEREDRATQVNTVAGLGVPRCPTKSIKATNFEFWHEIQAQHAHSPMHAAAAEVQLRPS